MAYLSISGFTAATGVGHIYRTDDFGATWSRADGNGGLAPLPDVPTLRILVDNTGTSGNTLLAGTDIGVFRSTDGGGTWAAFNLAVIPALPIFDLEQNKNGVIVVGTDGRGAFQPVAGSLTPTRRRPRPPGSPPDPNDLTAGPADGEHCATAASVRRAPPLPRTLTITNTTGAAESSAQ